MAHLLGLVMLVGAIGIVDLRLAGAWRTLPARSLARALTPVAIAGFVIMLPSGAILFAADAVSLAGSAAFRWKLVLIGLALANALAFTLLYRRRIGDDPVPLTARLIAATSVALWLMVGTAGRMIAYG